MLLLLPSRFSRVRLCETPQMAAHQAPPSLGFSRQEHWSGLPFPSPIPQLKAEILQRSAVSMVQLPHPYMTTGKTRVLTRQTFVGKVISLLFNMLSLLVITFLPRSKCLLISWLQSPSAVSLKSPKINSFTVSTVSPSICHEVIGPRSSFSECWALSQFFHSPLSLSSRGSLVLYFLP